MNKHKQILSDEELEIERLEFHKWANFYCHSVDRDFDGDYKFDTTHDLWESWQSAVASYKERLINQEPTQEMNQKGAYILSECLNDNAPMGQKVYEGPARLAYITMLEVALKGD